METGPDDQQVDLSQKIPVYIAYFTAYERDGQLYFGNDVYDRDREIAPALVAAVRQDAAAERTAAGLRELLEL
jgi:murein L,D-transpeptidase YcbB/YkuD